ncbi:MAG: hypothetical protein V4501_02930 [Pseudomonadota bacterium]
MLNLKNHSFDEIEKNRGNIDPYDTHLKSSISEITLAFPSKSLSTVASNNSIGFAPIGSWKNGWTGIKEFFEDRQLGICEYSKSNRKLSHGAVQIAAEIARFDINNLPNFLVVKGNLNSGYLYTIKWFDDTFNDDLVCANTNYNKRITNNLIKYAKLIATF